MKRSNFRYAVLFLGLIWLNTLSVTSANRPKIPVNALENPQLIEEKPTEDQSLNIMQY